MPTEDQFSPILQSRAARMATDDRFQCSKCRGIFDVNDGIITVFRGNILVGLCMDCFDERPIIMRVVQTLQGETSEAVEVRILSDLEATALRSSFGRVVAPTVGAVQAIEQGLPLPPISAAKPKVQTIFKDEG